MSEAIGRRPVFRGGVAAAGRETARRRGRIARGLVSFLLAAWASAVAGAEPTAYKLELEEIPEVPNGKVAFLEGTASATGDRFYIENLSILQPVAVTLVALDRDEELKLRLSKYRWEDFDREVSTRGTGVETLKLRTEGELKILVTGEGGEWPYRLAVWVGDEVEPEMPALVVPRSELAGADEGSTPSALWVIAGLLLGILVLLAMLVLRRGKR